MSSFIKGPDHTWNTNAGRQEIPGWTTNVSVSDDGMQRGCFDVMKNANPSLCKKWPWLSVSLAEPLSVTEE
jgi:hypothetical protein